jgi:signal transduction histidine kinase
VTAQKRAREALERERRTLQHMLQASDHERQLIAYDIHDGLAQELAGAIMQFQIYEQFEESPPEADEPTALERGEPDWQARTTGKVRHGYCSKDSLRHCTILIGGCQATPGTGKHVNESASMP